MSRVHCPLYRFRAYFGLLFLLYLPAAQLLAENIYTITSNALEFRITNYELLRDTSMTLGIHQVIDHKNFRQDSALTKRLLPDATYWIRFQLKNGRESAQEMILYNSYMDFYEIRCYMLVSEQLIGIDTLGSLIDYNTRAIQAKTPNFSIRLPADTTGWVYIYLDRRYLSANSELGLQDASSRLSSYSKVLIRGSNGAALLYLVVGIILFISFREKEHFFFLLYAMGYALFICYQHGWGTLNLWGNGSLKWLADAAPYLGVSLCAMGVLGLFRVFYRVRDRSSTFDYLLLSLQIILGVIFLIMLAWPVVVKLYQPLYHYAVQALILLLVVTVIVVLLAGVYFQLIRPHRDQTIFAIAFVPAMITMILLVGQELDFWQFEHFHNYNSPW